MASAKGLGAKGAAAGAERGASKSILNEELQSTLDLLKSTLAKDAERIAAGQKPFFKSPEEAAAYWDKAYKEISTGVTKGIYPIGPNAPRITYKKDGQLFTLNRDVKPPEGAERVSLTNADILKMMPPRPQVPPKPAGEPNAYNNPPPPEYTSRAAASPSTQEAVQIAKETTAAPSAERLSPRLTPTSPWEKPGFTPRVSPTTPEAITPRIRDLVDPALVLGAGGAGAYALDPNATKTIAQNILKTPYKPQGETNPNLDNLQGPGVSYSPEDFNSDNIYTNNPDFNPHMWNPPVSSARPYSGRENPRYYKELPDITPPTPLQSGREHGGINDDDYIIVPPDEGSELSGGDPRFTGPGVSYDTNDFASNNVGARDNFNPNSWRNSVSTARQVIQRAQNSPAAQAQKAAAILQQSPNQLELKKGSDEGSNALTRFIRGDFREGADQRIMEAMRRQREESGVDSSTMARGGTAQKKSSKDDVLHKALEIIHHMLTRR